MPTPSADADDFNALLRGGPFHEALRAAIRRRGLTLDRLRWHLAQRGASVALSTLSDWQHGHARPGWPLSLPALRGLEDVLRLPDRSLVGLLDAEPDRPVQPDGQRPGGSTDDDLLAELFERIPGSRSENTDVLARHDTAVIDGRRRATSMWTRLVLRAQRNQVDRCYVVYVGDPGCAIDRVRVRPVAHCGVGRVLRHPAGPVMVTELLFGEPLQTGDIWALEYELHTPVAGECTAFAHAMNTAEAHYVLEVRFDSAALPVDCHAYAQAGRNGEPRRTGEVPLRGGHAIHVLSAGASPGVVGIGWRWPEPGSRSSRKTPRAQVRR